MGLYGQTWITMYLLSNKFKVVIPLNIVLAVEIWESRSLVTTIYLSLEYLN